MKKKSGRILVTIIIVLMMLVSVTACSAPAVKDGAAADPATTATAKTDSAAAADADKTLDIVIIPKLVHEFYNLVLDGANQAKTELAADGREVNIVWSAPKTADTVEQAQKFEQAIAMKPDVIAISVIDGDACKGLMQQAIDAGIRVMAFDTDFEGSPAEAFVGCSLEAQKESGAMAADLLVKQIGKDTGKVAMLTGSPDAENHKLFSGGFEARMAEAYPKFEIVTKQADNDDLEKATSLTESILAQYPDIDGIFGGDGSAGVGAASAVKSAVASGQIAKDQVKISNYCLMEAPTASLKEGYLTCIIDYPPYLIGYYVTMAADAWFTDGVELQDVYIPFGTVTSENIDTYLDNYAAERAKDGTEYWKK